MKKKTQEQIVIDKLAENNYVDNFWAISNYILRLGAIIHTLRGKGWKFDSAFGTGANKKNCIYTVVQRPVSTPQTLFN